MKNQKSQINVWQKIKKPILALAPMAGYTDSAFRVICLNGGADLVYTEMISAEALSRENKKTLKMLEFLPEEKNVIVQLFGKNPDAFAKTTKIINNIKSSSLITHYSALVGIDINFGCPAHKIFKTGAGAALMDNKKIAREIIISVLENTKLPVSIKIRSQVKNTDADEFVTFIKDLPIAAVMIHGRSLTQGMTGPINFEMIKKVKKLLPNKIVIANGGVNSPEDAHTMLKKTGADGIGIGRGALGRPWIFSECRQFNVGSNLLIGATMQNASSQPVCRRGRETGGNNNNWEFLKKQILIHAKLFLQQNDNLIPLRKHLVHYFKGQKNASEIRQKIIKVKTLADLEKILV